MAAPLRLTHAEEILTPPALAFVAALHRRFAGTRADLLARRIERRAEIAGAGRLTFGTDTAEVRDAEWTVARAPGDLTDRRVEIRTGPIGAGMLAAINAGAQVWVADFAATPPSWANVVAGQLNVRDALLGTVSYPHADGSVDRVRLDVEPPTVTVRPRDWLLPERNLTVDGEPAVAALVDFGLYAFHNAASQYAGGSGAYFCLPVDGHLEARLWADVFVAAEELLGLGRGALRATALIHTLPGAAEMDEILYELRSHALGLALDLEGYLFSHIDCLPGQVLPATPLDALFGRAAAAQLVRTAHRRGTHAIGPVRADNQRLAAAGFDGAQAADPAAVAPTAAAFTAVLGERPNQISRLRYDVVPDAAALTDPAGLDTAVSSADLRSAVAVLPAYLTRWLATDIPAADPAQIELARAQVWQWVHAGVELRDTGTTVTADSVRVLLDELAFDDDWYELARLLVEELCLGPVLPPSAALAAYELID